MTRNLVICLVPTVLAFFAVYWLKRRKKTKPVSDLPSKSVHEIQENTSSVECASDIDNTLFDACSFTSPTSSEKSSQLDSRLFDSPLHVGDGHPHCDLVLRNYTENSQVSFNSENKDFLRIGDLKNSVVTDSEQVFEPGIVKFENDSVVQQSSKYKALESPILIKQNLDFFESKDLFLSEANKDYLSRNNQTLDLNSSFEIRNNNPENCIHQNIVDSENLDNLTASSPTECEEIIETDCQSSVFDENSLSYVSDDSEGKQFAESLNKDSLSSVLDESSLLSSFCDELDKSSASNSPTANTSRPSHLKIEDSSSPKDILNLLPFNESLINIQNFTDSYAESLKESNLDKHLEVENNNSLCPDPYKNSFGKEKPFRSEVETFMKNLDHSDQRSFNPKESDPVQNNLSAIKDLSLTSNDAFFCDSKTLNIDAVLEVVAEASSVSSSRENGCNTSSSCSGNGVNSETYASILNKNSSSSDAATCILQQISSELNSLSLNSTESVNNFPSSNWTDKAALKSTNLIATNMRDDSKQVFSATNEILSLKRYCEIKTNNDLTVDKNSTSSHQKDSHLELSAEEGYKTVKQGKLECNGFLDQKTSKEYVYEFDLPQELCGRLIGKYGRNVKSIMEQSNANVFIKHHPYDPLLKVVVVEGHRADVNEALEIIRRKYPPSMFPSVTLVQTNVLSSTGVPMPESLQLHLPEGASCDVILSSLVSAGHFFLQQPTHPTYPSLSTLDQCMINLYSQMDTPLLPQPIEAGVICAAPVFRGWYRAQVVYICDNSSDCGIKFVDYGGFSQVPISSLRQIRSDFMSLPFQASECYLAQVRPLGGDTWSSEATSVFEELAQGQILQALLVEYADDGIPCVYLYRVQGVSSTFINKELVERGLAEWVSNNNHWDPH